VAAVVLFAVAVAALRAEDKKAVAVKATDDAAQAAASGGKPTPCVPAQKDPQRHEQFLKDKEAALKKGPIKLVFIGDSITDAWRHGEQNKLYTERWGRYNPLNLGISGDKTEHVLWRLEHGELDDLAESAKGVVIMIGTNNLGNPPKATPEDTAKGVECVVKAVRHKLPEAKVLLLAVFPRGMAADDPYRAQIKTINDTISKLADGQHVRYLDIGQKFLGDDGTLPKDIMPDALHPNEKGYQLWADAIDPAVKEMMGGNSATR
jgi:beta-glucosidase